MNKMDYNPLSNFYQRLQKLKPAQRKRFLHGVYKQLTESKKGRRTLGEYSGLFDDRYLRSISGRIYTLDQDTANFVVHVADSLKAYEFKSHSYKMLKQHRIADAYDAWKETSVGLDRMYPEWRKNGELHVTGSDSIRIDFGGFSQGSPFSASIVYPNHQAVPSHPFEICPRFDGKEIDTLFGDKDPILLGKTLDEMVSMAKAVIERNWMKFKFAYQDNLYGANQLAFNF